jgi:hypothetical protein
MPKRIAVTAMTLSADLRKDLRKIAARKKAGKVYPSAAATVEYARVAYGIHLSASTVKEALANIIRGNTFATVWTPKTKPLRKYPLATLFKEVEASAVAAKSKEVPEAVTVKPEGNEGLYVECDSKGKVRTVEDAIKKAGVDMTRWDVKDFLVNSWEMGAVIDGKMLSHPLWQVKVWFKAKRGWNPTEFRNLLVEDLRTLAPAYTPVVYSPTRGTVLAGMFIFDSHFGKLAWRPESGADYDLSICRDRYMAAGRDLYSRAAREGIDRYLYVVGQDFFHTDQGRHMMTTAGTLQDCDGRWQKAFRVGTQCSVTLTEEMAQIAPVTILVVPGNHDAEKSFCLGDLLAARFHKSPNVEVINNPSVFSYYRYGVNLLGFVHGDTMNKTKRAQLPATMATDCPEDWAETYCREWMLGHRHVEEAEIWHYISTEAVREVAVRTCPSLSGTDAWHRHNNYKSVISAECHLYHKANGRCGSVVHQVCDWKGNG